MKPEQLEKMRLGKEKAKAKGKEKISVPYGPLKAIRRKCLDCCENFKYIKYCPCDGFNSTRCELWPYRFGLSPTTAALKYGKMFLTPEEMPNPNVCLDDLPA